jgi:hypothetical protein
MLMLLVMGQRQSDWSIDLWRDLLFGAGGVVQFAQLVTN